MFYIYIFRFQKFSYPEGGRIYYHEIDDWISLKMFKFEYSKQDCFQVEFYGCPEGNIIILLSHRTDTNFSEASIFSLH